MVQSLIYDALVLCCWLYAMLRGAGPERIGATVLAVGSALTFFAVTAPGGRFGSVEIGVLAVDMAALLAFLILALRAERFWPIWVTALQAIGTAGHGVKMAYPELLPWGYAFALAFWSYPMLLLLVLGTWNHQRRLARHGADRSWSTSSARWGLERRTGPTA